MSGQTSVTEISRQILIDYFTSGCKGGAAYSGGSLGVEVEHFIVTEEGCAPVFYEPHGGLLGVRDILGLLLERYPQPTRTPEGDLVGCVAANGTNISIEPAAQLEISIRPYPDIAEIEAEYQGFRDFLDTRLAEHGLKVCSVGYHPTARALDLPLIPKDRYRLMDRYFAEIGTHGHRMMRATASTQVSVDYADEADAVRKMRVANALAPVLAYITDNVPVFEGEPNSQRLRRFMLWRDVDNRRCGTVPGVFDEDYGFAHEADWLLSTSPIFVTRPEAASAAAAGSGGGTKAHSDGGEGTHIERYMGLTPAAQAYGDAPLSLRDVEHLISMFWPDARLKRFVEVRPADCMPAAQIMGYTALIKGIFYREASLCAIEDWIGVRDGIWPLCNESPTRAGLAIIADGDAAQVYGHTLSGWVQLLFGLAREALPTDEGRCLDSLQNWDRGGKGA